MEETSDIILDRDAPVRISITVSQTPFGGGAGFPEAEKQPFGLRDSRDLFREKIVGGEVSPEDLPDEMEEIVMDILDNEGIIPGIPTDEELEEFMEDADDPAPEEWDEEEDDGADGILERLFEMFRPDEPEEEEDSAEYEMAGSIRTVLTERGETVTELEYEDVGLMEGTSTVIRYDPGKPGTAVVTNSGNVSSVMICEEGARHTGVYKLLGGNVEMTVYTKKCRGGFRYPEGGELELDYIIEIRGGNLARTRVTVKASPLGSRGQG